MSCYIAPYTTTDRPSHHHITFLLYYYYTLPMLCYTITFACSPDPFFANMHNMSEM